MIMSAIKMKSKLRICVSKLNDLKTPEVRKNRFKSTNVRVYNLSVCITITTFSRV